MSPQTLKMPRENDNILHNIACNFEYHIDGIVQDW